MLSSPPSRPQRSAMLRLHLPVIVSLARDGRRGASRAVSPVRPREWWPRCGPHLLCRPGGRNEKDIAAVAKVGPGRRAGPVTQSARSPNAPRAARVQILQPLTSVCPLPGMAVRLAQCAQAQRVQRGHAVFRQVSLVIRRSLTACGAGRSWLGILRDSRRRFRSAWLHACTHARAHVRVSAHRQPHASCSCSQASCWRTTRRAHCWTPILSRTRGRSSAAAWCTSQLAAPSASSRCLTKTRAEWCEPAGARARAWSGHFSCGSALLGRGVLDHFPPFSVRARALTGALLGRAGDRVRHGGRHAAHGRAR
jgi:hypothetical protein